MSRINFSRRSERQIYLAVIPDEAKHLFEAKRDRTLGYEPDRSKDKQRSTAKIISSFGSDLDYEHVVELYHVDNPAVRLAEPKAVGHSPNINFIRHGSARPLRNPESLPDPGAGGDFVLVLSVTDGFR